MADFFAPPIVTPQFFLGAILLSVFEGLEADTVSPDATHRERLSGRRDGGRLGVPRAVSWGPPQGRAATLSEANGGPWSDVNTDLLL